MDFSAQTLDHLASELSVKIASLQQELDEGDITNKGFEKKMAKILAAYHERLQQLSPNSETPAENKNVNNNEIPDKEDMVLQRGVPEPEERGYVPDAQKDERLIPPIDNIESSPLPPIPVKTEDVEVLVEQKLLGQNEALIPKALIASEIVQSPENEMLSEILGMPEVLESAHQDKAEPNAEPIEVAAVNYELTAIPHENDSEDINRKTSSMQHSYNGSVAENADPEDKENIFHLDSGEEENTGSGNVNFNPHTMHMMFQFHDRGGFGRPSGPRPKNFIKKADRDSIVVDDAPDNVVEPEVTREVPIEFNEEVNTQSQNSEPIMEQSEKTEIVLSDGGASEPILREVINERVLKLASLERNAGFNNSASSSVAHSAAHSHHSSAILSQGHIAVQPIMHPAAQQIMNSHVHPGNRASVVGIMSTDQMMNSSASEVMQRQPAVTQRFSMDMGRAPGYAATELNSSYSYGPVYTNPYAQYGSVFYDQNQSPYSMQMMNQQVPISMQNQIPIQGQIPFQAPISMQGQIPMYSQVPIHGQMPMPSQMSMPNQMPIHVMHSQIPGQNVFMPLQQGTQMQHHPVVQKQESYTARSDASTQILPNQQAQQAQQVQQWQGMQNMPYAARPLHNSLIDRVSGTVMNNFEAITAVLQHRILNEGSTTAYTTVDEKGKESSNIKWDKLGQRANRVAQELSKRKLTKGVKIGMIYRKAEAIEMFVALYGVLLAGCVSVPIVTTETLSELRHVLTNTGAQLVLSTDTNYSAMGKDLASRKEGWPGGLEWIRTNSLGLSKKAPATNITGNDLAYIEFSKDSKGELRGVGVSHRTIVSQCLGLKHALQGTTTERGSPSDTLVTYIESRQQSGFIFAAFYGVFVGQHTVVLSSNALETPGLWVHIMTRYRATFALADYAGLQAVLSSLTREPNLTVQYSKKFPPDLSSLRRILIDTVQPDALLGKDLEEMLARLGSRNQEDIITPFLSLAEHGGMILAMRDLAQSTNGHPNKPLLLNLDRKSLQQNVIVQTDENNQLRIGTFGFPTPQTTVAIVDPETKALVPAGMVGEIWVDSPALSGGFWGLPRHTQSIFRAHPLLYTNFGIEPLSQEFLRSGLIGSVVSGELLVFGFYEDRIRVNNAIHYAMDIMYSIMSFVSGISACAAFEVLLCGDGFLAIAAETTARKDELPHINEKIDQVLRESHNLQPFCVILGAKGSLPRSLKNGRLTINIDQCHKSFKQGALVPSYLKFTHGYLVLATEHLKNIKLSGSTINLPQLTAPPRLAKTMVDERNGTSLDQFSSIIDMLIWRMTASSNDVAFTILDAKGREQKNVTFKKFSEKVASLAAHLREKSLVAANDNVLVLHGPGLGFNISIFACMILGATPIPISSIDSTRLSEDIPALMALVDDLHVRCILATDSGEQMLRNKMVQNSIRQINVGLPPIVNVDKKFTVRSLQGGAKGELAMVYFTADMRRCCVRLSHTALIALCRSLKGECMMLPVRPLLSCTSAWSGLGLIYGSFMGIYIGCTTFLQSHEDVHINPRVFFDMLMKYKIKDVLVTYTQLHHAFTTIPQADQRSFSFPNLKSMIMLDSAALTPSQMERVQANLLPRLNDDTVITTQYAPYTHIFAASRAYKSCKAQPLDLSLRHLQQGIAYHVDKQISPDLETVHVLDAGKASRGTHIAIVNPVTGQLCPPSHVGEIWVASDYGASGFVGPEAGANAYTFNSHFKSGPTNALTNFKAESFTRTGDLGFLWMDLKHPEVDPYVYLLGSMEDTFDIDGHTHFVHLVERTIESCHQSIFSCVVLHLDSQKALVSPQVVVIAQVKSTEEASALALVVPIVCAAANVHCLVVNQIVFVSEMRRSRHGNKQRDRIRHMLISGAL